MKKTVLLLKMRVLSFSYAGYCLPAWQGSRMPECRKLNIQFLCVTLCALSAS